MFWTYILKSLKSGKYYIGSTNDFPKRLVEHNSNVGVRYTKSDKPRIIVHRENFDTLSSARKRELEIKSWKNRRRIENLINRGPIV